MVRPGVYPWFVWLSLLYKLIWRNMHGKLLWIIVLRRHDIADTKNKYDVTIHVITIGNFHGYHITSTKNISPRNFIYLLRNSHQIFPCLTVLRRYDIACSKNTYDVITISNFFDAIALGILYKSSDGLPCNTKYIWRNNHR